MSKPHLGPRGRGRRLIRPLQIASVGAFGLGLAGALLPRDTGRVAGLLLLALLVATPAARVLFLAQRWWRLGDRRYASVALALVGTIAAGTLASVLR